MNITQGGLGIDSCRYDTVSHLNGYTLSHLLGILDIHKGLLANAHGGQGQAKAGLSWLRCYAHQEQGR